MRRSALLSLLALFAFACNRSAPSPDRSEPEAAPQVKVAKVFSQKLSTSEILPAELTAYQNVAVYPRVNGFVEEISIDRGSIVRRGQLLARLSAPELAAQRAEADAKASSDRATYERLKDAAKTPGAVAKNELDVARDTMNADLERARSLRTLEEYLVISAPFDGVITERDVHTGALVGPPSSSAAMPMVKVAEIDHLRLTVPVPESDVGSINQGVTADFTVSAWPGRSFSGAIARISHSVDQRTRTMPVELDVDNRDGKLAPGMFAQVRWPVRRGQQTLFVPASAVVESMEQTFVEAVRSGHVRHVAVKRGRIEREKVEVFGPLSAGDLVVERGSEELVDDARVSAVYKDQKGH